MTLLSAKLNEEKNIAKLGDNPVSDNTAPNLISGNPIQNFHKGMQGNFSFGL